MRYSVECYENQSLFTPASPGIVQTPEQVTWCVEQPNRLVAVLFIEAESAQGAADGAFEIANAPWNPEDAVGFRWLHDKHRSMSSGDSVWVHTPDGIVGFVCLMVGWARFRPSDMNIAEPSFT